MNTAFSLTGIGVLAPVAAVALAAGSTGQCGDRCSGWSDAAVSAAAVRPVGLGAPQESRVRTHIKVVQQDDSGTYELVIENGQPRAKVNGKEVPADRIVEQDGGVWVIQDENGEQVAKFHIGAPPAPPPALGTLGNRSLLQDDQRLLMPERLDLPELFAPPPQPRGPDFLSPGAANQQPRTMLGVVMGPADQSDGAGGVLLDRIVEGLSADRAGLKSGDVIVGIEGAEEATPEKLRALLREKAPGDELRVRVLREGEEKDISIKLDAFDGEKLVQAQPALPPQFGAGAFANSFAGLSREAREEMHAALRALTEAEQLASGDARRAQEQAREAIEQFVGALERMESEGLSTPDAMRGDLGRWFSQFKDDQMVWGDEPGMVFTLPRNTRPRNVPGTPQRDAQQSPGAGGSAEIGDSSLRKTEQLEARLNAMSARLERIEKLLEKLTAEDPAGPQTEAGDNPDG